MEEYVFDALTESEFKQFDKLISYFGRNTPRILTHSTDNLAGPYDYHQTDTTHFAGATIFLNHYHNTSKKSYLCYMTLISNDSLEDCIARIEHFVPEIRSKRILERKNNKIKR